MKKTKNKKVKPTDVSKLDLFLKTLNSCDLSDLYNFIDLINKRITSLLKRS